MDRVLVQLRYILKENTGGTEDPEKKVGRLFFKILFGGGFFKLLKIKTLTMLKVYHPGNRLLYIIMK